MTKREAQAMLKFRTAINSACSRLERALKDSPDLDYARAYYLAHIRQSANGQSYGSAPITKAEEVLGLLEWRTP